MDVTGAQVLQAIGAVHAHGEKIKDHSSRPSPGFLRSVDPLDSTARPVAPHDPILPRHVAISSWLWHIIDVVAFRGYEIGSTSRHVRSEVEGTGLEMCDWITRVRHS